MTQETPQERSYIPPDQRFKPASGTPIPRIMTFMPQRDRQVPLKERPQQPAQFMVDERTESHEHFDILTYKRIREEVVADLTKKPGSVPLPAPAEDLAERLEAAVGNPPRALPEPVRTPTGASRMAAEKIRELEDERAVLLRLAERLGEQIEMLRRHAGSGEEITVR